MTELSELQSVTSEVLASKWQETDCSLDVCCATNGAYMEIY